MAEQQNHMPCTGCMGPTSHVIDHGAKALSAIASLIGSDDEDQIAQVAEQIVDPVGTFYRYSLPASLLHRRREPGGASSVGASSAGASSGGASA